MVQLMARGPALIFPKAERLITPSSLSVHLQAMGPRITSESWVTVGIDVASESVEVAMLGGPLACALYVNGPEGHGAGAAALVAGATSLLLMEMTAATKRRGPARGRRRA